jgi:hypothetical protein
LKLQGGLLVRGKGAGLVRREEGSEEEGTRYVLIWKHHSEST